MLRFTQVEFRVGGIVLLKQFLMADDRYQWFLSDRNRYNVPSLSFHIVPFNRNERSPVHTKHAHIGFAASSSPSLNDKRIV